MDNQLFFLDINRRTQYSRTTGGTYYKDYQHYRTEISEDCKHRCVYCDITEPEIGFEGMVLDHFRPTKHFSELVNDPTNIVLSCPKCNRLKSDHWPAGKSMSYTHNGVSGFLDPFIESRLDYFVVEADGHIFSIKHPAGYIEKILLLNRISRVRVRLLRILRERAKAIIGTLIIEFNEKLTQLQMNSITKDEFIVFCKQHREKLEAYHELNSNM